MPRRFRIDRRRLLTGAAAAAGAPLLGGCDKVAADPRARHVLEQTEVLTRWVQRLLTPRTALAPEYAEEDISPAFKPNGTTNPDDDDYQDMVANKFADWRLDVGGLVARPAKFTMDALRAMPSRTQITRHDCVEGWSCIAKWKGAMLGPLLRQVEPAPNARYVVFHCADPMDSESMAGAEKYYESIDFYDAYHPQTILAYDMNDAPLPVRHGAPLRLRVERQLGYKMAKYLMRIELVENFASLGAGMGGSWEDRGYAWYAGI